MKANWGERAATIQSQGDLDSVIEDVRRSGQPTMVILEAENGNFLVFGVGQEESVLTFAYPDGRSFHSLGADRYREGSLYFLCNDDIEEFMAETAVPEQDAITAAKQFLTSSDPPPAVQWESDW